MASTLTRPPQHPSQPSRKTIWQKLRLATWRGRFGWVLGLLVAALVIAWLLVRATPSWYQPLDVNDHAVIDAAGRADNLILFDLRNTVQDVPLGTQRWSITQDEVNAFLAIRTASPLNPDGTRMPPAPDQRISDPYVIFEPGFVSIAARLRDIPSSDPRGGVGTLTFSVGIVRAADGSRKGLIKLAGARAGYVPLPTSVVEAKMRAILPGVMATIEKLVDEQIADNSTGTSWADAVADAFGQITRGEPFPLEYKVDKKHLVIDGLEAAEGKFTLVLSPPERGAATVPERGIATVPERAAATLPARGRAALPDAAVVAPATKPNPVIPTSPITPPTATTTLSIDAGEH
jgi:hypothetical protein